MRTHRAVPSVALVVALLIVLLPGSGVAASYTHDGKLLPGISTQKAFFGDSVAIDGNTAVIAAPADNSYGGVIYVFERLGSGWQYKAKLTASDGNMTDDPLRSVAISGETIVVGRSTDDNANGADAGAVYIFVKPQTGWVDMTETRKLLAEDGADNYTFGTAVAIEGNTLVVGSAGRNSSHPGAAYVFERVNATWEQRAKLTASDGSNGDLLGFALDLDGGAVVVGAYGKEQKKGAVYVFNKPVSGWIDATEDTLLVAQDRSAGDQFGFDLAINDGHIIVGADGEDTNGADGGAVYLFSGTGWSLQEKYVPTDGFRDQGFGYAVDILGDTAIVGALLDNDKGLNSGSIYVYGVSSGVLTEQEKLTAPDGGAEDRFGSAVAMTDSYIVAGAYRDAVDGKSDSGSAYVFSRSVDSNAAPQAQNDSFETEEDSAVTTTNVLANDTDPDGDALSISLADSRSAQNGTVVNNGDGTFTYTPPSSYTGVDSFSYSISDGRGGEAQATVLITVNAADTTSGDDSGGGGGGGSLNPWLLLLIAGFYQAFFSRKRRFSWRQ